MDTVSSFGWLLPAWIIGAPFIGGIVMWMRTPRSRRGDHELRYDAAPGYGQHEPAGTLAAQRR